MADRGPPRPALRLRPQRGWRPAAGASRRRPGGHDRGGGEAGHLASDPGLRARRARLDPRPRRQPAPHASAAIDRLLDHRPRPDAAPATARCPGRARRAVARRRRSGRLGGRAAPRPCGPAAADDPVDRHPDRPRDLRAEQRDPAVRGRDLRLQGDRRPERNRISETTSTARSATTSATRWSCSSRSPAGPSRRSTRRSTG